MSLRRIAQGLIWTAIIIAAVSSASWAQAKNGDTQRDVREKVQKQVFQTSDRCFPCHNGLMTPGGEDVSISLSWRPTMMANSSRDPYWQSGVRRETIDHPEARKDIEDECSICHMPMARFESRLSDHPGEVFSHLGFDPGKRGDRLAQDGVSCSLCHQIANEKLGTRESFIGGFVVDTTRPLGERQEYGPFEIQAGQNRIMRTSSGGYRPTEGDHIRSSEVCATCHTLYTKALGPGGQIIGELPEQMPYQEWSHSDYKQQQTCQNCHMPPVGEPVSITNILGITRLNMGRHIFVGGNFFMLRLLNRFRSDLSVSALPEELQSAADRTVAFLQTQTAQLSIESVRTEGGTLQADIAVQNLSGHKFPTAYPARRAWLHVTVKDRNGQLVFESGALQPNGAIRGNDNDEDATRFEPHYTEINSSDQVQIYEAIMVGPDNKPTTGLLTAVGYAKDNRLLPRGFDKQTADNDVAVQGNAKDDPDFTGGGDKIRYNVAIGTAQGPFQVDAELLFQPISYRWANNLRSYNAEEDRRFVGYYEEMASGAAVRIAHASTTR